jgi:tetratricopeptide (TPR) repeat protein
MLPKEPAVWQNIALVQRQMENYGDAVQSLTMAQAIKHEPQNIVLQAFCLMNMGQLAQARDLLLDLVGKGATAGMGGSAQQAQNLLSANLIMLDQPKDLLKLMEAWGGVSDNAFLSSLRAQALIRTGDMGAAGAALREGSRRFPGQLLFRRASTIQPVADDAAKGTEALETARTIKRAGLESSAYLFAEFRQWAKCLGAINEMLDTALIDDIELLLLQSTALESQGMGDDALRVLRRCHRLEPNHPTVQNNLGYHLLERDREIARASELIAAALAQEPGNASYMDSWGWALFKQGKYKEAEAALRRAVETNPQSPESRKHLGDALLRLDRPQEALEQWERALAFASPDRKGMEDKVSKLKTELAKKALEDYRAEDDPADSESDQDDDYDGWRP